MKKRIYLIYNIFIAGVLFSILLFSFLKNNPTTIPKTCVHVQLLGKQCPICNISNGIYFMEHGKSVEAKHIQPFIVNILLFVVGQFCFRIFLIISLLKNISTRTLVQIDIFFSFVFLIITLNQFIAQIAYTYYKMLLTGIR